jgi:hypothetical protein
MASLGAAGSIEEPNHHQNGKARSLGMPAFPVAHSASLAGPEHRARIAALEDAKGYWINKAAMLARANIHLHKRLLETQGLTDGMRFDAASMIAILKALVPPLRPDDATMAAEYAAWLQASRTVSEECGPNR